MLSEPYACWLLRSNGSGSIGRLAAGRARAAGNHSSTQLSCGTLLVIAVAIATEKFGDCSCVTGLATSPEGRLSGIARGMPAARVELA